MGQTANVASHLADIRYAFLLRLAEKGTAIDVTIDEIRRHGPSADLRDAIVRNVHQTAGVAPSYGYVALGETARRVESAWSEEFSATTLEHAMSVTDDYLDLIQEVLQNALQDD